MSHTCFFLFRSFGHYLINKVKICCNFLVNEKKHPPTFALFKGSRWTFQARHMNGDIGFYTILPDQIQVANPVMILLFIPIFNFGVYPLLNKFGLLKSPLQKIVTGGFLAALAFVISGGLDLLLEVFFFKFAYLILEI